MHKSSKPHCEGPVISKVVFNKTLNQSLHFHITTINLPPSFLFPLACLFTHQLTYCNNDETDWPTWGCGGEVSPLIRQTSVILTLPWRRKFSLKSINEVHLTSTICPFSVRFSVSSSALINKSAQIWPDSQHILSQTNTVVIWSCRRIWIWVHKINYWNGLFVHRF